MSPIPAHLLVALAFTVVVGLVSGGTWPYFVMGAGLALSLWVMLFAGSWAGPERETHGRTSASHYAVAAAVALVLGYAMYVVGDGASWWATGVILAGVLVPAGLVASRSRAGDGA
ncbi:hypothetical protein HN031_14430 [Nocardioides sp. zg-1308]|uniref:Uncharacterized protein n=1 Tax=Nocardioides renjunii TaxID=3095075 RepID=A0ABU5KBV8_9ACTN|nr:MULTISPECIES: hypothetical protein [unclassified Nocardioides]MDZ5662444.1 hypothetical protein [Nocardioides sp. S-58]NPD05884.1 hypothetical protein [Nocardioides sp. zg-1308]WQQ23759.1 hypothetical protein SHK17_07160 [Nocardioides sp. S-34]